MNRKIVYFLEIKGEVTGAKKIIPDILEKMPQECDVETYYINLSGKKKVDKITCDALKITENVVSARDSVDEKGVGEIIDDSDILLAPISYNTESQPSEMYGNDDEVTEKFPEDETADIMPDEKRESEEEIEEKEEEEIEAEEKIEEEEEEEEDKETGLLKFIALEDCDFSEFKDATFIVPINYLFFLLSYISDYKEAKVCPYIYDSQCIKYFLSQIKNPNIKEISEMFNRTKSCLFISMDEACGWDYGIEQYLDSVIPASVDFCTAADKKKTDFNPGLINIGWIGAVTKPAYECITRFCEDLYKIYNEGKENIECKEHLFDFHIIGNGVNMGRINFKKFSPLIRFILPGEFKDDKLDEYICSNIDLAVGYNMNAVKGASCGVPTIIPAIDDEPVSAKRTYVYFEDAKEYILCWSKRELHRLAYNDYTMEEVLDRLKNAYTRKNDSQRCFEHAVSRYSYEGNAKRIAAHTYKSSLTIEQILEDPSIDKVMKQLDDYRAASEENSNATYFDYFNRNKKS